MSSYTFVVTRIRRFHLSPLDRLQHVLRLVGRIFLGLLLTFHLALMTLIAVGSVIGPFLPH